MIDPNINTVWEGWMRKKLPPGIPDAELAERRAAFLAGAAGVLELMLFHDYAGCEEITRHLVCQIDASDAELAIYRDPKCNVRSQTSHQN